MGRGSRPTDVKLWVCDQGHVTEDAQLSQSDLDRGWEVNTCKPPGNFWCGRLQWEVKNEAVNATYRIAGWEAASAMWRSLPEKERK